MKRPFVFFGDVHLNVGAEKVIFDYAKRLGINSAITLGDEDHPNIEEREKRREILYNFYRKFKKNGSLVCIIGDKTGEIPQDFSAKFMKFYKQDNIIAGHDGSEILDKFRIELKTYHKNGTKPLIILHGHDHHLGVDNCYKHRELYYKNHHIISGSVEHDLLPWKNYWINPGGNFHDLRSAEKYANFGIYDPAKEKITLITLPYNEKEVLLSLGLKALHL